MMEQVKPEAINHLIPRDPDLEEFDEIIKNLPKMVQSKLELSRVFHSIHQKMNKGLYYQDILDSVFTSLDSLIPFDRIGIALLESGNQNIRLNWVKSKLPISSLKKDYVAKIEGSSLEQIITTQQPRIINDLEDYFKHHPQSEPTKLALEDGIHSSLTCPLVLNGISLGVIFFSSAKAFTYENSHIALYFEIAQGLAIIIQQGLTQEKMSEIESKEKIFRNTIHDLNNPLSIIQLTLDRINKQGWSHQLGEDSEKALNVLKRNCESMLSLVKDLVEMNNLKSDTIACTPINCSLDHFLTEVINDSEVMAKKKNILITLEKDPKIPNQAQFDPFRLREALFNYISNAIKFSKENTHVTIKLEFNESLSRLYFYVIDQGPGIPEEEQNKLFKEFGKTSVRPTANESSTGLGLANVKRLIESHHGEVFMESQSGRGSTFGFWVPLQN